MMNYGKTSTNAFKALRGTKTKKELGVLEELYQLREWLC